MRGGLWLCPEKMGVYASQSCPEKLGVRGYGPISGKSGMRSREGHVVKSQGWEMARGTSPSIHLTHPCGGQRDSNMAASRMEHYQKAGSVELQHLPRCPSYLLTSWRCRSKMAAKSATCWGCGVLRFWRGCGEGCQLC